MRYPPTVPTDRDDDLARTATAVGSASSTTAAEALPTPAGATLGRYRLERELGTGGMGVVHAAFDPDLERRVALKVLRVTAPSLEAKDRLMREARAMARLAHPNVVTVHEVGTANGRDFVAMELIQGETLAEWLRSTRRTPAMILDAFIAAGRGLAAAHAAGIVHRDFKPHNVLRSRDGRIAVTDFGLAREAEGLLPVALETTLPVGTQTTGVASTPSTLAGITVTGALLGTPAYMAPEQWSGGAVTPATDQFAYCVALWEALAGDRPYRGPTLDELRLQVGRGPAALDASRIPRRLRGILRRGLDPAPGKRWPNMDRLLAELVRASRGRQLAFALAGGALVGAVVLLAALRAGGGAPTCEPPARPLVAAWSPALAAELRARTSAAHADVLEAAAREWSAARARACTAPSQVRQAQLACLDGVLGRFDVLRQAYARVAAASPEDIHAELIDPEICRKPSASEVPRLMLAPTPDVIAAYELFARSETERKPGDDELARAIGKAESAPCARVVGALAFQAASKDVPRARTLINDAVSVVDQCGDERLRADLLTVAAPFQFELPILGAKGEAAIKQAQAAAQRVLQPDVEAMVASLSIVVAQQRQNWAEVDRLTDLVIAGYGARGLTVRQLHAVTRRDSLRLVRGEPGDLAAVTADVAKWRPIAAASREPSLSRTLDMLGASAAFFGGDVVGGHAELMRAWWATPRIPRPGQTRELTGEVVDASGRPIAGATVAAATLLASDAVAIGLPLYDVDGSLRFATTDAAGKFTLHDAASTGAIAAQLGDRRSLPVAIDKRVRLVLAPTRSVIGTVALAGVPHTHVQVYCSALGDRTGAFQLIAPVAADGSFAIKGAPTDAIRIGVAVRSTGWLSERVEYVTRPVSPASIRDLHLAVTTSNRVVDVVVRSAVSAPLDGAQVVVLSGKQQPRNVGDLMRFAATGEQTYYARPVVGENAPPATLGTIRTGDLVAHIEHATPGALTVCAIGMGSDMLDLAARQRMFAHLAQLTLRCEQVAADASIVVVPVPPQARFD